MRIKNILNNNKGVAMVLLTIAITLVLGFGALVTDVGLMALEKTKLQNAIDSATLAAAAELPSQTRAINAANRYVELNGYTPSDVTVNVTNGQVNITGNKKVNFHFARIFGMNDATTSVSSTAIVDTLGAAFNYAVFSGSEIQILVLNGSNMTIDGDVHSNKSVIVNGSKLTITGACEAANTITTNGSQISIGEKIQNADYVAMPDFSDQIEAQSQVNGTYFQGSKTYSGSNMNVDGSIYVTGDVTVNGSHFNGKGCVVAEGDIIFNGSNLNQTMGDSVCFYSKNGNIIVNGSNAVLDGIVYAPNGRVIMNGSNQTINGRVIADVVTFNGSSLNVLPTTNDLVSLPKHGVKLVD